MMATAQKTTQSKAPLANNNHGFLVQRKCSCGSDSKLSGQCENCEKSKLLGVQAKLRIGAAYDTYEQEADRVADLVMRTSTNTKIGNLPLRIQRIQNQPTSESHITPISVDGVLARSGIPLKSIVKHDMEQRFGQDFSQIRVHLGASAEQSALEINAHAYTVGNDIVFGKGSYAPETSRGQWLLAHELTHTVQQSTGSKDLSVQRDVIDEVRNNLSYGIIDWAVTDSEAMESLALLGTIDPVVLVAEISKLESKYVTRLIDNLPDVAKTGDVYKRIITAIGASGVAGHVTDQLSYGLFDWAITDVEVTRVFNTFVNLPAADQEKLLADLNSSGLLGRLIDNSTTAHHSLYIRPWISRLIPTALTAQQRSILRVMASETSDNAIETLKLLLETRFNLTVGPTTQAGETPADWTASNMRSAYLVLDQLPDAHVARNKKLLALGQFTEASRQVGNSTVTTVGQYDPATREFALNTEAQGDLSDTIRHETAHAVDREMGWSKGVEPAKNSRGGWKTYPSHNACATEMVDDSNGGVKSDISAVERTDVIAQMATAMGNRSASTLRQDIRNRPWFSGLAEAKKTSVLADKALDALGIGLVSPWFNATDGGEHLGNHVYQESYTPTWVRYRHEARSRFISNYQFRDPGEWFAEAYDLYYTPDSRGRGAKLDDIDSNTKTYFDNHVHTRAPTR